jgi:hypothetical protein
MGSSSSKSKSESASSAATAAVLPAAHTTPTETSEYDAPPDLQFDIPSSLDAAGRDVAAAAAHQSPQGAAAAMALQPPLDDGDEEVSGRVAFGAMQVYSSPINAASSIFLFVQSTHVVKF